MPTQLPPLSHDVAVEILVHGAQSRARIVREMGLSPATVTRVVKPLLEAGVLVEAEAVRTPGRGRSSLPLDVVADSYRFIGVSLAANCIHGVVTDLRADILQSATAPVPSSAVPDVVESVVDLVGELRAVAGRRPDGVGVTVGGLVTKGETVADLPRLHGHEVPLRSLLADAIDLPVYLDNDVTGLTKAQQWFGHGRGWSSFALITVGAGIGYGLVINDELVPTRSSRFGHFPVDPHGPLCSAGHRGCLTAYVTSSAISAAVSLGRSEEVSYDDVLQLAGNGDPLAMKVVGEAAHALGRATTAVTCLTGVDRIILAGEGATIAKLAPAALRRGRQAFDAGHAGDVEPVLRPVDLDDWARGAAVIAIQEVFP